MVCISQVPDMHATFIFFNTLFFTSMVILTIFFVAWLFSLAFLELMIDKFTKNLREKTKSRENSVIAQLVYSMEGTGVMLSDAHASHILNKNRIPSKTF